MLLTGINVFKVKHYLLELTENKSVITFVLDIIVYKDACYVLTSTNRLIAFKFMSRATVGPSVC